MKSAPSIHSLLRDRLHAKAGLLPEAPRYSLDHLEASQWSPEFERLMRNRMIMGGLRYGLLGAPGKPLHDHLSSIAKRLDTYRDTGNLELLVDCANLCLVEFVEGRHVATEGVAE